MASVAVVVFAVALAVLEEGVPFPGAEIRLEFLAVASPATALLPTGSPQELLRIDGLGEVRATLIGAGDPTVIVRADTLGLSGRELPEQLRGKRQRRMGLAQSLRGAHGMAKIPIQTA